MELCRGFGATKLGVGENADDGRDVGAEETENERRHEKQSTFEGALSKKAGEATNGSGENEDQPKTKKPRGENTDDKQPHSALEQSIGFLFLFWHRSLLA